MFCISNLIWNEEEGKILVRFVPKKILEGNVYTGKAETPHTWPSWFLISQKQLAVRINSINLRCDPTPTSSHPGTRLQDKDKKEALVPPYLWENWWRGHWVALEEGERRRWSQVGPFILCWGCTFRDDPDNNNDPEGHGGVVLGPGDDEPSWVKGSHLSSTIHFCAKPV